MGWVLRQADRVEPHRCKPPRISQDSEFWSSPDGQVGDVWECDDCGDLWEIVQQRYRVDWQLSGGLFGLWLLRRRIRKAMR
jgi:hypothetical protein